MKVLLALAIPFALCTCMSAGVSIQKAIADCDPAGSECTPEQAAILPYEFIRQYGSVLIVACPYTEAITPEYRADCTESVQELARALSAKFASKLHPIETSRISYSQRQVYMDTYIPGREQADLVSDLTASIPLVWRE